jgi:hypothetical protein
LEGIALEEEEFAEDGCRAALAGVALDEDGRVFGFELL